MNDKIKIENKGKVKNLTQIGSQKAGRDILMASGDIHYHPLKEEKNIKLPLRGANNFFLDLAKNYWGYIEKKSKNLIIGLVFPIVSSIVLIQNYYLTKLFSDMTNLTMMILGFILLIFLISLISAKFTTSCPYCKESFAMREVDRELTGEKKVGNKIIRNMKVVRGCRYCHKETKPYTDIDEEEIFEED